VVDEIAAGAKRILQPKWLQNGGLAAVRQGLNPNGETGSLLCGRSIDRSKRRGSHAAELDAGPAPANGGVVEKRAEGAESGRCTAEVWTVRVNFIGKQ
jgi:hypothetical protein